MTTHRDQGLDVLRCLAIMLVLLLHAAQAVHGLPVFLKELFSYGWIGVDLFFVLSGFLIGQQVLIQSPGDVKKELHVFWAKRWFRTFPLYFVVLFAYLFLKPLIMRTEFFGQPWPFFFFVQNYFPLMDYIQSWSICIEEQFYLLLPLISFIFFRKSSKQPIFWLAMFFLCFIIRYYVVYGLPQSMTAKDFDFYLRFPIHTHFDGLAMGVLLASTRHKWEAFSIQKRRAFALLGLIVVALSAAVMGPELTKVNASFYFSLTSIGFALMLVGFRHLKVSVKIYPVIYWVALLSYGSYLWNNIFIRAIYKFLPNVHWLIGLFIFLLVTHLVAFITYQIIEKPGLKLRKKYLEEIH